jgi:hypothetical protein
MKKNHSIIFRWQGAVLILAVVLFALFEPAYCQVEGTALLLQQTPEGGGTVTPAVGVHHFEQGTEVTLTAIPQPGYQFICWLGDVSDQMAGSTAVYLDAPKIVIAVFEQAKFEFAVFAERSQSAPGGGLYRSPGESTSGGFGGAGAKRPSKRRGPVPTPSPTPIPYDEFPVPEVPEPATICLFGLGSLMLLRKHRDKRMFVK